VYAFIKSAVDGAVLTGVQTFNLKNDGVGLATSNSASAPFQAAVDAAAAKIKDGSIVVPNKLP